MFLKFVDLIIFMIGQLLKEQLTRPQKINQNSIKSCIFTAKKYGFIELIATKENQAFVICRQINELHHMFYDLNFKSLKHSCFYCDVSDSDFFFVPITEIRKVFLIKIDEDNFFVNYFKSTHLYR